MLIFDEVFLGFRLARGGAQEYFGVRADMVTYGKTVAGGLPIGVVCGRGDLMKRFREDRPADLCFARGTFNAHPYVMGAMAEFLERLDTPEIQSCYRDLDEVWNGRAAQLNERLQEPASPCGWPIFLRYGSSAICNRRGITGCSSFICAPKACASWVGTGRLIFSLDYTDADFAAVADRFVARGAANAGRWLVVVERDA